MQIYNNTQIKEISGEYATNVLAGTPLQGLEEIAHVMHELRSRTSFQDVPLNAIRFGPTDLDGGNALAMNLFASTPIPMPHASSAAYMQAVPSKNTLATILNYGQAAGISGARKAHEYLLNMPVGVVLDSLNLVLDAIERYGDERSRAATNIKARIVQTEEGPPVITQVTKAGHFFDGMDLLIALSEALTKLAQIGNGQGRGYLQAMTLDRARFTSDGYLSAFLGWGRDNPNTSRWITANGYSQAYKIGLDVQGGPASTIRVGLGVQGGACQNTYRLADSLFSTRHNATALNGVGIVREQVYGLLGAMGDGVLEAARIAEMENASLTFDWSHPLDLFEQAANTTLPSKLADTLFDGFVAKYSLDETGRRMAEDVARRQGGRDNLLGFANMVTAVAHEPAFALPIEAAIDAERTGGALIAAKDHREMRRLFDVKVEALEDWRE